MKRRVFSRNARRFPYGPDSPLARAMGRDFKGKISIVVYLAAIPLAFLNRWIALACYIAIALMWLIPDRRIETRISTVQKP